MDVPFIGRVNFVIAYLTHAAEKAINGRFVALVPITFFLFHILAVFYRQTFLLHY